MVPGEIDLEGKGDLDRGESRLGEGGLEEPEERFNLASSGSRVVEPLLAMGWI